MEPSDNPPEKSSSDTDPCNSAEPDSQQGNSSPVNSIQTSDSNPVNAVEVTENGSKNSESPEGEGNDEGQSKLLGCEVETEERINPEETEKTSKEAEEKNFFKYIEEFAHTIKKFSVITTYTSRRRPKQPYFTPNDESTNAQAAQGTPHSALTPRPPEPPRVPGAARPPEPPRTPGPPRRPEPSTQQPAAAPGTTQRIIFPQYPPPCPLGPSFASCALFSPIIWAPFPKNVPSNVPNLLAHLVFVESLFVIQISYLDYFANLDEFFLIQNKNGECLYLVYETTDLGQIAFCESCRAYRLHFIDMYSNETIRLHKLAGCASCACCFPEMEVFAPPSSPAGFITTKFSCNKEEYILHDPDRNRMFKMVGPCCATSCFYTFRAEFVIRALDENETEVGFIRREFGTATFFDNGFLGLTMPADMDDFIYYAKTDGFSYGPPN